MNNENSMGDPIISNVEGPESGRSQPNKYYFDDASKDAIPESEMPKPETVEAPVETPTENPEVIAEAPKAPEAVAEVRPAGVEVARQRREAVSNFFKNAKEGFKNKAQSVGNSISSFFSKVKAFGNKALDVAIAPDAYIAKGVENVGNFVSTKAERVAGFVSDKIEFAKFVTDFAEAKTAEKFEEIQRKAVARYEALKQFGADAIEAGHSKVRAVKEGVRTAKNNMIIAYLKSIEERHRAKADKVAQTIQLLQGLKA